MSAPWTLALALAWAGSLLAVLPAANWRIRRQERTGPVLSLLLMATLWQLTIPNMPGLPIHLLGVTAAALVCGPSVAYLQVCLLATLFGVPAGEGWRELAMFCLAAGAVPAALTALLLRAARRRLPPNVFLFIFVNACLAGAGGMLAYVLLHELLLLDRGSASRAVELAILLPLPEAILTGTVIAPLVAFRSRLVHCFEPDRYFGPGID